MSLPDYSLSISNTTVLMCLAPWGRAVEKLLVFHVIKEFAVFYRTQRFVTVITPLNPTLSQMNPSHTYLQLGIAHGLLSFFQQNFVNIFVSAMRHSLCYSAVLVHILYYLGSSIVRNGSISEVKCSTSVTRNR